MHDPRQQHRHKLRALLREIRRERAVTQVELAARLDVPQSVISKYENGERQLEFAEVLTILSVLGVSLRTFCYRWEAAPPEMDEA